MSKLEEIKVTLTPEMAAALQTAVDGGEYVTAGEVIREALLDWILDQDSRKAAIEELRRLVQEGIDSGVSELESMDEIIAEAKRRFGKIDKAAE